MEIRRSRSDDVLVLSLIGDLDGRSAPAAQEEILPALPPNERILLDLSELKLVTSAGLRTMLLIYRQARARNSTVALVGLSAQLRNIMSATGFLTFFVVTESVEDGLVKLADAQVQSGAL